jgi:succinate dehydrogenase / fumarate reductase membrane anchor subunit
MAATENIRRAKIRATYESTAWKWMRYSAFLLIPLVWGHMILQDVIVGVHAMDLDYVAFRWASTVWRVYDALLLGFALAHGVNGLRQVAYDYIHGVKMRNILNWGLFIFWLAIFLVGFIALLAFQPTMPT